MDCNQSGIDRRRSERYSKSIRNSGRSLIGDDHLEGKQLSKKPNLRIYLLFILAFVMTGCGTTSRNVPMGAGLYGGGSVGPEGNGQ